MKQSKEIEIRNIENKLASLAKQNVLSPKEVMRLNSFLQVDVLDFDSPERAIAKELLCFRVLEALRESRLIESTAFDCCKNYFEKGTRSFHGAYRKPFCFPENSHWSVDLTGSKNEEYPIRLVLTYNENYLAWNQSACIVHLTTFKVGHSKLENIPSFDAIKKLIAEKIRDSYIIAINTVPQVPIATLNFRRWLKGF